MGYASPADRSAGENKRKTHRAPALTSSMLVWDGGARKLACTIMDLSQTGARVRLAPHQDLPADFFLIAVKNRMAHAGVVVWERTPYAGLHFTQSHGLNATLPKEMEFLRRLWFACATR